MNKVFGARHRATSRTIGLSQIAGAQFLHVYEPAPVDQLRPGRPAGLDHSGGARRRAPPTRRAPWSALSGDYDFQFLIEELAVGAQFRAALRARAGEQQLPRPDPPGAARLRHGLLRAARASRTSTSPTSARAATAWTTSSVVEGLGCKAMRVHRPGEDPGRVATRRSADGAQYRVPVVVEVILEQRDQHRDGHRDRQHHRVRGTRLPPTPMAALTGLDTTGRVPCAATWTFTALGTALAIATNCRRTTMPRFAANLTMLFNEVPFLDRFERRRQGRLQGASSSCFPTPSADGRLARRARAATA
ncbi:MAG: hypothetical protein MZV49_05860 [Rhodopseudomonas palustris]|nr:hypothetical protein [Rhodopseudomonas palustris]